MASRYQLTDEPRPSGLSHLTVNPFWPLLAFMLGGAWIGWPWFVLNAFAMGSPTRWRELAVALLGLVGAAGLAIGCVVAADTHVLEGKLAVRLALLSVVGWKLLAAYLLYEGQARPFALHEYFGGRVRQGGIVAIVAFFVAVRLESTMPMLVRIVVG